MNPRTRAYVATMASALLLSLLFFVRHATAQQAAIPAPESVLGFSVGADFKLATYDESLRYFQRLDEASDRLQLVEVGRTSEGRNMFAEPGSKASSMTGLFS